jgi:hypothetical protein
LIDLCNAISLAFAIPIAVFDVVKISHNLEVRYASGDETYLTFNGDTENPNAGEVIFVDAAAQAHARRWTNRQSGYSAVRDTTTAVLIVAEAMQLSVGRHLGAYGHPGRRGHRHLVGPRRLRADPPRRCSGSRPRRARSRAWASSTVAGHLIATSASSLAGGAARDNAVTIAGVNGRLERVARHRRHCTAS